MSPPRRPPARAASVTLAAAVLAALAVAGCAPSAGHAPSAGASRRGTATRRAAPGPPPASASAAATTPPAAPCQAPDGFSCAMAARIGLVQRYLAGRPGQIGIVLHDRQTGATWSNPAAGRDFPAASTVKLAMVTDLLLRNGAGQIHLGGGDWNLIEAALHVSSDHAADLLWQAYEGPGFLARIRGFGMGSAFFTTPAAPYWGFMYCSASDLDHLMNFVLGRIPAGARLYLTRHLQHVAPIQQWGVWGAGRPATPATRTAGKTTAAPGLPTRSGSPAGRPLHPRDHVRHGGCPGLPLRHGDAQRGRGAAVPGAPGAGADGHRHALSATP